MTEGQERARGKRPDRRARHSDGQRHLCAGVCCRCGVSGFLTGIVMLSKRCPTPGEGWGCLRCGLTPDGAFALLCSACCDAWNGDPGTLLLACRAGVGDTGRVAMTSLTGEHRHRREHHPEMGADDPG